MDSQEQSWTDRVHPCPLYTAGSEIASSTDQLTPVQTKDRFSESRAVGEDSGLMAGQVE